MATDVNSMITRNAWSMAPSSWMNDLPPPVSMALPPVTKFVSLFNINMLADIQQVFGIVCLVKKKFLWSVEFECNVWEWLWMLFTCQMKVSMPIAASCSRACTVMAQTNSVQSTDIKNMITRPISTPTLVAAKRYLSILFRHNKHDDHKVFLC